MPTTTDRRGRWPAASPRDGSGAPRRPRLRRIAQPVASALLAGGIVTGCAPGGAPAAAVDTLYCTAVRAALAARPPAVTAATASAYAAQISAAADAAALSTRADVTRALRALADSVGNGLAGLPAATQAVRGVQATVRADCHVDVTALLPSNATGAPSAGGGSGGGLLGGVQIPSGYRDPGVPPDSSGP